jgi:hypothetical protein
MLGFAALAACASTAPIAPRTIEPLAPSTIAPPLRVAEDPVPSITVATRERAEQRLRQRIESTRLPTAYVLSPALLRLDLTVDADATVRCGVEVRASPASPTGDERWEGGRTAIAVGRALVTSSSSAHEVEVSIDTCIDAAADQVVRGRVLPFIARTTASR